MTGRTVSRSDRAILDSNWDGKCAYCRRSVSHGVEIDHIVPFFAKSMNETDSDIYGIDNLCYACYVCNRGKGGEDAEWWMQRLRKPTPRLLMRFFSEYQLDWFLQEVDNDPCNLTLVTDPETGNICLRTITTLYLLYREMRGDSIGLPMEVLYGNLDMLEVYR